VTSDLYAEQGRHYTLFLLDGLSRSPSPVLLVVADAVTAGHVAVAVHNGTAEWADRPTRADRLLQLDVAKLAAARTDTSVALLTELASTDHWILLPDIDRLVDSLPGRAFLDDLVSAVGRGEVAAVIASTLPERLADLQAEAPRLSGFATAVRGPGSGPGGKTTTRSVVVPGNDAADAGWIVAVRYDLSGPVPPNGDTAAPSTDGRLRLVESMRMIVKADGSPDGVIVSLKPEAFTVSQESAALAVAELAGHHLIGRSLTPGERVTATRALYYA